MHQAQLLPPFPESHSRLIDKQSFDGPMACSAHPCDLRQASLVGGISQQQLSDTQRPWIFGKSKLKRRHINLAKLVEDHIDEVTTVAHTCAAERIWITRLKGEKPQGLQKPDRLPDVGAARREWAELEGEMREQLARLGPEAVERTIDYQDLRGNDQSDVIWQILQHVVNHGTYHRGQITTMLRQLDAGPPKSMDLIAFYRERDRKA